MVTTLSHLSSGTFHTPNNVRLASLQIMFPEVIGKVNMGIIQRDGCNRVRGQQTESGESSHEWARSGHFGAKTLNEQNIDWPSLYPLGDAPVSLSRYGLGFIRVL